MPKYYLIARIDVRDPEGYKEYIAAAQPALDLYGGRFLSRGGAVEVLEGEGRGRNIVAEFASVEAAKRLIDSPEYDVARKIRQKYSVADIVLVEGTGD